MSVWDTLKVYWWILLIGSLVILGVVSIFILTFKGKKKQSDFDSLDPLLGSGSKFYNFKMSK